MWLETLDVFSGQGFQNVVLTSWHQQIYTTLVLSIRYTILDKALIPLLSTERLAILAGLELLIVVLCLTPTA